MKNASVSGTNHSIAWLRSKAYQYRKPLIITTSVLVLQLLFGWDAKFCIINIIWLFV